MTKQNKQTENGAISSRHIKARQVRNTLLNIYIELLERDDKKISIRTVQQKDLSRLNTWENIDNIL